MARVSIDDLAFAAEWIGTYDPAPDEADNADRAARMVAWLQAEIDRRTVRAASREGAKIHGVSAVVLRRVLRRRGTVVS